ncbi:MAG: hypothetical protein ACRDIC_20515, partial [bacterium]
MPIRLQGIWTRLLAAWAATRRGFPLSGSPGGALGLRLESAQFIGTASAYVKQQLADVEERLQRRGYMPRLLIREDANAKEAVLTRDMGLRQHNAINEEELDRVSQVVIIGNAGAGKSMTLYRAFAIAARQFLADPARPVPLVLDLGADLAVDMEIMPALNLRHQGLFSSALAEHSAGCALFIDTLDEAVRYAPQFINTLRRFIHDNGHHLARLVVTCRRTAWDSQWSRPPFEPTIYHLDYLDHGAYERLLPVDAQRSEFYKACEALGVTDLLDIPFHGFYLARQFLEGRDLPNTRRRLLDRRISDTLQTSPGGQAGPAADRLRFLAQQLACVASFTTGTTWTTQE